MEKLNPELNAVIHELYDRARAEAAGALPDGPFRGVPFLLKDLGAELAGTPFNEGMAFSGDYLSTVTQALTQRYIDAGFVICGKTNTPELGILPTTEPRASDRRATRGTPGTRPAAPRAVRPPRSRRAWCRRRTPTTAAAPSAFPPRAAASSG